MNPDVSVAPEIAQLMERPRPAGPTAPTSLTVGDLARELRQLTGTPEGWWTLVRFDPQHPLRVEVPTSGTHQAWLSILPPSAQDDRLCTCDVITVVAGELTEHSAGHSAGHSIGPNAVPRPAKPLLPGQVRVHGAPGPHQAVNTSDGYTVSVHLRAHPGLGGMAQ